MADAEVSQKILPARNLKFKIPKRQCYWLFELFFNYSLNYDCSCQSIVGFSELLSYSIQ